MFRERDIEDYLEEERYKLLKLLNNIFLIITIPTIFLEYLANSSMLFLLFVLIFLILVLNRELLAKRKLVLSTVCIIAVLLIISQVFTFLDGFLSPVVCITFLISICLCLMMISVRSAILYSLLFLFFSSFSHFPSAPYVYVYERNYYWQVLEIVWFLSIAVFVLYRCCLVMKVYNEMIILQSKRYRNLAKLEYHNRLLGKVSKFLIHDISSSLSVITGSIYLIKKKCLGKRERSKSIDILMETFNYIEDILNSSVSLVKTDSQIEMFDPDENVNSVLKMSAGRLKNAGIVLETNLEGGCLLRGCVSDYTRLVFNILINSVEELESLDRQGHIWVCSCTKGDEYVLSIRDNGRGINPEVLKILEKGNVVDSRNENIGLGMFYIFNTVEAEFKGKVKINTGCNVGTEVICYLPFVDK